MWVIHHGCAPALTLECNLSSLALVRLGHFVKNAAPLRALNGVLLFIAQSTFVDISRHLFYYVCIYIIYDILGYTRRNTYCSWKSNIGGSNRMGRQFPRCLDVLWQIGRRDSSKTTRNTASMFAHILNKWEAKYKSRPQAVAWLFPSPLN